MWILLVASFLCYDAVLLVKIGFLDVLHHRKSICKPWVSNNTSIQKGLWLEGDWEFRRFERIGWKRGIHQILPNPLLPKPLKYSSTKWGLKGKFFRNHTHTSSAPKQSNASNSPPVTTPPSEPVLTQHKLKHSRWALTTDTNWRAPSYDLRNIHSWDSISHRLAHFQRKDFWI